MRVIAPGGRARTAGPGPGRRRRRGSGLRRSHRPRGDGRPPVSAGQRPLRRDRRLGRADGTGAARTRGNVSATAGRVLGSRVLRPCAGLNRQRTPRRRGGGTRGQGGRRACGLRCVTGAAMYCGGRGGGQQPDRCGQQRRDITRHQVAGRADNKVGGGEYGRTGEAGERGDGESVCGQPTGRPATASTENGRDGHDEVGPRATIRPGRSSRRVQHPQPGCDGRLVGRIANPTDVRPNTHRPMSQTPRGGDRSRDQRKHGQDGADCDADARGDREYAQSAGANALRAGSQTSAKEAAAPSAENTVAQIQVAMAATPRAVSTVLLRATTTTLLAALGPLRCATSPEWRAAAASPRRLAIARRISRTLRRPPTAPPRTAAAKMSTSQVRWRRQTSGDGTALQTSAANCLGDAESGGATTAAAMNDRAASRTPTSHARKLTRPVPGSACRSVAARRPLTVLCGIRRTELRGEERREPAGQTHIAGASGAVWER